MFWNRSVSGWLSGGCSKYNKDQENLEIVEFISAQVAPLLWVHHYNFFNPEEFGAPPFIFIRIVRDPVERVTSDFLHRTWWTSMACLYTCDVQVWSIYRWAQRTLPHPAPVQPCIPAPGLCKLCGTGLVRVPLWPGEGDAGPATAGAPEADVSSFLIWFLALLLVGILLIIV